MLAESLNGRRVELSLQRAIDLKEKNWVMEEIGVESD